MGGAPRKHLNLIVLAALLALTLSLLVSNLKEKTYLNLFEKAVLTVMGPVQGAIEWGVTGGYGLWDSYIYLVGVREENRDLRRRVDKLAFENTQLVERLKRYKRIDGLISFPRLSSIPYEVVRVIGRDTTGRVRVITVNKGSDHGLAEKMPVITHRGLVGRVVRVSRWASKVLLITDVRSAVDALTQESRDTLVAVGSNAAEIDARYLSAGADVRDGDRVISSGLGGVFPKGLLIGFLTDIKPAGDSLFVSARLKPAVDLEKIEEALVLKDTGAVRISGGDWP